MKAVWKKAATMAEQTPEERNRFVDFLRALSISAVVLGHWLMAAPLYESGAAGIEHLLDIQPWSRWLTWIFQVMPVFFFVGGYSNGVSWDSAQKRNQPYADWLVSRFQRMLSPVIPLLLLWIALGAIGYWLGVHHEFIRYGSQVALVPVWFLAIYFLIVMLVPVSRNIWNRFGISSVIVAVILAAIGDWIFFNTNFQWLSWLNYLFIWSAVHQLGYAWQQGKIGGESRALQSFVIGLTGLITLVLLTRYGPYPISLVGVPSQEISNTEAPKLPLMALGTAQIGLLLSIEGPMRRWLAGGKAWTATVLMNGMIMPIFLWHSTIMMLLIGLSFWVMPDVFLPDPGSSQWWLHRIPWLLVYMVLMLAFLPAFLLLEKLMTKQKLEGIQGIRLYVGSICMIAGLALCAAGGVVGTGALNLNWYACLLPLIGGALILLKTSKGTLL